MVRAVNEEADPGNAVAFIIEVRLYSYPLGGPVLRVIGKPETIFVEVVKRHSELIPWRQ